MKSRATWVACCVLLPLGCSDNTSSESPGACVGSGGKDASSDGLIDVAQDPTGEAFDGPHDAGAESDVAGDAPGDAGDGAVSCPPAQQYSFPLGNAVALACGASSAKNVLEVQVPAAGRALARASLVVQHQGAAVSTVTHFWNARVEVGSAALQYALGDDVCPGTTSNRVNMGTGRLDSTSDHVKVWMYQGSSPCTDGALTAAASLDVWVESDQPGCEGSAFQAASFYEMVHTDTNITWNWPTTMAKVLETGISTSQSSEKLRVLAVIEGTPHNDPNTVCGAEAASLVIQTALDGAILATVQDVVPASGGMGHLVLSADAVAASVAPGKHTASLLAGSNFVDWVTTGGCCGDGFVAVLRVP